MSSKLRDVLCLWKQAYVRELEIYGSGDLELDGYLKLGCNSCLGLDLNCDKYSSIAKMENPK